MKIIFFHPAHIGTRASGSGLRPQKMVEAFKATGHHLEVICGTNQQRKKAIGSLKARINSGERFDLVYFENLSSPLLLRWVSLSKRIKIPVPVIFDLLFLLYCLKKGLKVSYFVRDIHWNFFEIYEGMVSKPRLILNRFFGKLELAFLRRYIKNVFVPSENFANYVKQEFNLNSKPLPPGSDVELQNSTCNDVGPLKFMYVGGCSPLYDPELLFTVFTKTDPKKVNLTFCTRQHEWEQFGSKYDVANSPSVKIVHLIGEDLNKLYGQSCIAVYSLPPQKYAELTIAFKVPEYICAGKPIIAYEGSCVAELIKQYDLGWVIPYEINAFKRLVEKLQNHRSEVVQKQENVRKIRHEFSWKGVVERLLHEVQ